MKQFIAGLTLGILATGAVLRVNFTFREPTNGEAPPIQATSTEAVTMWSASALPPDLTKIYGDRVTCSTTDQMILDHIRKAVRP